MSSSHVSAVEQAGLGTLREGQRSDLRGPSGRDGRLSAEALSVSTPAGEDAGNAPHSADLKTGTVKWFNTAKGFAGFRLHRADDGSNDVFVHVKAVERAGLVTLREGQRVRFAPQPGATADSPPKTSRRPASDERGTRAGRRSAPRGRPR